MISAPGLALFGASLVEVNPGLTFWTIVTFLVVALLLRWKAWGPILGFVKERERAIEEAIEASKREREEAAKLIEAQKALVIQAQQEAAEQARRTQIEMERLREEMLLKSRQESDELLASARRTIAEETARAQAELRAEAVEIALNAAERLMKSSLDDREQRRLVTEFIAQLDQTRPAA
ncbi:MAG: F0F1 ATP synthase subunit B [Myxococcales bacterium]|jgi:F-type H+-transporting ATPase subunit b|nr:F0F1 ATP synthase subunit B [Myxococcales bacterium]